MDSYTYIERKTNHWFQAVFVLLIAFLAAGSCHIKGHDKEAKLSKPKRPWNCYYSMTQLLMGY